MSDDSDWVVIADGSCLVVLLDIMIITTTAPATTIINMKNNKYMFSRWLYRRSGPGNLEPFDGPGVAEPDSCATGALLKLSLSELSISTYLYTSIHANVSNVNAAYARVVVIYKSIRHNSGYGYEWSKTNRP